MFELLKNQLNLGLTGKS